MAVAALTQSVKAAENNFPSWPSWGEVQEKGGVKKAWRDRDCLLVLTGPVPTILECKVREFTDSAVIVIIPMRDDIGAAKGEHFDVPVSEPQRHRLHPAAR